jgi:hypothetical protein
MLLFIVLKCPVEAIAFLFAPAAWLSLKELAE